MKTLLLAILLCASPAIAADTFDGVLDKAQADNLIVRDELVATRTELLATRAALTTAKTENINQNVAFKATLGERDKTIAKQSKTLHSPWVRGILFVRTWLYILIGAYFGLGLLAIIGGVCLPGTALFRLSSTIIRGLPLANWVRAAIDLFQKTTTVRAKEVPIVSPPAVVAAPGSSDAARKIAAMYAAPVDPNVLNASPLDTSTNLGVTGSR